MKDQGWIKLHRSIKMNSIYQDREPFCKRAAWMDILLEVNHSAANVLIGGREIVCNPGESLNSLDTWARRWRWDKSKVRRFFKLLQSLSMIETKNESKTTRLTVCNWASYQNDRHDSDTTATRYRHDTDTIPTPNKNEKKDKNENNEKTTTTTKPVTPPVAIDEWIEVIKADELFREQVALRHNVFDNRFDTLLEDFVSQKNALGELTHRTLKDFKNNFWYWIPKYLNGKKSSESSAGRTRKHKHLIDEETARRVFLKVTANDR